MAEDNAISVHHRKSMAWQLSSHWLLMMMEGAYMDNNCNQIEQYKNNISQNNISIKNFEKDIENLNEIKKKMKKLLDTLTNAASSANSKINGFPGIFLHVPKLGFFSQMINQIKGNKYNAAISDINSGIKKIDVKIEEFNSKIANLRKQNNVYSNQIKTLENTIGG